MNKTYLRPAIRTIHDVEGQILAGSLNGTLDSNNTTGGNNVSSADAKFNY